MIMVLYCEVIVKIRNILQKKLKNLYSIKTQDCHHTYHTKALSCFKHREQLCFVPCITYTRCILAFVFSMYTVVGV